MKENKTIFILCSGFGWGNCARQAAIIEELVKDDNIEIHIFTWGNGLAFFKSWNLPSRCHLIELKPYSVSGRSYIEKMLKSFLCVGTFLKNLHFLKRYKKMFAPDVVIFDSDYSYLAFLERSAYRISINQAADIVERSKRLSWSLLLQNRLLISYFIEHIDFFIQKLLSHFILVPSLSFKDKAFSNKKIKILPLIVRLSFRSSSPPRHYHPAVILSGSGLHRQELCDFAEKQKISLFDPSIDLKPHIIEGEDIKKFNPIVTQSGLSTLSELLAMKRQIYLCPIPHHLEQYLNTRQMVENGLGIYFDGNEVLKKDRVFASLREEYFEGAEQAASFILNLIRVPEGLSLEKSYISISSCGPCPQTEKASPRPDGPQTPSDQSFLH